MATKKTFGFALGDKVKTALSGETGIVIGRAHYLRSNPQFFVEYIGADGIQRSVWFDEEALIAA